MGSGIETFIVAILKYLQYLLWHNLAYLATFSLHPQPSPIVGNLEQSGLPWVKP
jgi:hypothetical protein